MSNPTRNYAGALLLGLALAGPALAELADRDKPIAIDAGTASFDDKNKISIYEGNVVLVQGTLTLHASRLTLHKDAQGFTYATAVGSQANFRQKMDNSEEYIVGNADRMEYNGKTGIVELFVKARVKRGSVDEVNGDYIYYDMNSANFRAAPAANAKASTPGRVRVVIQPQPRAPEAGKPGSPAAARPDNMPPPVLKPADTVSKPNN